MNIGLAIKSLREKAGMSQGDLSEKSGVSQTSLSHIEQGKREPSKKTVGSIAKALGIEHDIIIVAGVERKDVPRKKRTLYDQLMPVIHDLIDQLVVESSKKATKHKKKPAKKAAKKRK